MDCDDPIPGVASMGNSSSIPAQEQRDSGIEGRSTSREEFFEAQILELQAEIEQVLDGTHPNFRRESSGLELIRKMRVDEARRFRELQIASIERQFDVDKKQADDEFEEEIKHLKQRLLNDISARQKKLEAQKKSNIDEIRPVRRLRTRRTPNESASTSTQSGSSSNPANKLKKSNELKIHLSLAEEDILEDLRLIASENPARTGKKR